jgi:hypothetical protein
VNKLLILSNTSEEYAQELKGRALPELEIHNSNSAINSDSIIREANIILKDHTLASGVLERAEKLKWVQ